MDLNKMRIYLLKQIESGEATDNVRRSIKEGERLKNFFINKHFLIYLNHFWLHKVKPKTR